MSVRRSKLGFRGFLPTPVGELSTKFESDLFGVGAPIGRLRLELFL